MVPNNKLELGGKSRRQFLKASGAGAVAVTLAGCSGGSDEETETTGETTSAPGDDTETTAMEESEIPQGGTWKLGLGTAPKGLNPLSVGSAFSQVIMDLLYEGGTAVDPVTYEVQPNAFTDWTVENADSGEPEVFVNVREGLTFNDGESFGVDDVVFTYNYIMDQQPGEWISTVEPIDTVETASGSDWDVHMRFNRPVGTYDSDQLSVPLLPEHVWSDVDDYQTYAPTENGGPVGLGPARVTKYEADTAVGQEIRDDYTLTDLDWIDESEKLIAGGPFIDEVQWRVFGSSSALDRALLEGQIDSKYGGMAPAKIPDVENQEGMRNVKGQDDGNRFYMFNVRDTPMDDLAFRQVWGFAFDDRYNTQRLLRGYELKGDFVMPPGFRAVRPETDTDQEIRTGPSTNAFDFRQSDPGVVDVEGIRSFLTEGRVIDGSEGTYVGKEYPGSLTGVQASQSEAKHEYTFGPVESDLLEDEAVDKEIRVNGQTIGELKGRPLQLHAFPSDTAPRWAKMGERFTSDFRKVGVPIELNVMSFNTLLEDLFTRESFDASMLGFIGLPPFAVSHLYSRFHGDNADDHSVVEEGTDEENAQVQRANATGYGLSETASADDLISQARSEMNPDQRNQLARQAIERIYLDMVHMVLSYGHIHWPVNSGKWAGFIENIAGPSISNLHWQTKQVYLRE